VWAEVRTRREYRSAVHREALSKPAQRYYLLRGLVMCGRCGTLMSGTAKSTGPAYQCNRRGRNDEKKCTRSIAALTLEVFVVDAAVELLGKLRVDGRLASSNLAESVTEELEDDQRQLGELNQMWTAKEISTAEYRKMRKEITDRITKAQRKVVVRPMVLLDGLTGAGARAAWNAEDMTDERRNAVLRFLFSGVVIDEPKKFGRYMDWDRIGIEQNPL
jgi:site-specific DNA recombinase